MKTIFTLRAALLLAFILMVSVQGHAQYFLPGNVLVTRVGDGTTTLTTALNVPITVQEYAKSSGSAVVTSTSLGDSFRIPGALASAGQINLSADGRYLSVFGFDSNTGTYAVGNAKAIARIDNSRAIDYSTKITSSAGLTNAVSADGSKFWMTAAVSGTAGYLGLANFGQAAANPTSLHVNGPSRVAAIFNNQLFALRGFSDIFAYNAGGSGLPTAAATFTKAVSLSSSLSSNGFVFFDLDPNIGWNGTGLDVVYVGNNSSGLEKYYWNGNDWKAVNTQYSLNVNVTAGGSGYTTLPTVLLGTPYTANTTYTLKQMVRGTATTAEHFYVSAVTGNATTDGTAVLTGAGPFTIPAVGGAATGSVTFTRTSTTCPTAIAVLTGGVVTDVIISQASSGVLVNTPTTGITTVQTVAVSFSGGEGSGATATANYPNNSRNLGSHSALAQMVGALDNSGNPVIYAIRGNGATVGSATPVSGNTSLSGNDLIAITDASGRTSALTYTSFVTIASPGLNYAFRGLAFAPSISKTWTGTSSTNHLDGSNWADGTAPLSTDFINIPTGLSNYPVISANTIVAGVGIASGATLTVNENIVLTNSGTITNNGNLILKSSALGTASLTSPTTVANVTQQRYLNSNQRGWRLLSSPVSTKTFSDLATASGITIGAGYTGQYNPVDNTWSIGTGYGNMATQQAYKVFITGLVGQAPTYLTGPSNVTFVNKGTATNTAPAAITTTAGQYYLVANPYTAPVSVSRIISASTGLSNTVSYYNPENGSTDVKLKFGGYNTPTVSGAAGSDTDVVIPAMGAIFVQASSAGTINVPKTAIFTGTPAQIATYSHKTAQAKVALTNSLKVEVSSGDTYYDTVALQFKTIGDTGSNIDFGKLPNSILEAYTIVGTQKMAVSELELVAQTIPLGITSTIQKSYTFKVVENTIAAGFEAVLVDNVLNTNTVLVPGTNYNFAIDTNSASQGDARFSINLRAAGSSLGVNTNELEAKIQVYPNPSRGEFNISNTLEGAATIEISSLNGQLIHSQKLNSGTTTIQTKSWATGVYILKATNNGVQTTKKLIIQ